ncbi:MAG: DNA repair protein RadC [Lentisphaeria bacterium]|nr:DNA repair protein RadC [Lentisphaeria bacterium]
MPKKPKQSRAIETFTYGDDESTDTVLTVMERGGKAVDVSGHRQRLRERFADGGRKALADYELLELLLTYAIPRIDTKPLAKRLLAAHGSLHAILHASAEELQETDGLGPNSAAFLKIVQGFLTRSLECEMEHRESIRRPEEVVDFLRMHLAGKSRETVMAIYLDDAKRVLRHAEVGSGTVDKTAFYPREILAPALECGATGIILVHNHPGGEAIPSDADHAMTRKLEALAKELDIRLLDHLITTPGKTFSLKTGRLI